MSVLLIFAILAHVSIEQGVCVKVFLFQADNQLSNESQAVLYLTPDLHHPKPPTLLSLDVLDHDLVTKLDANVTDADAKDDTIYRTVPSGSSVLTDFSVCLWVKVFYFREQDSYVFSYATSDASSNEMNFGMKYNRINMYIENQILYHGKENDLYIPDTWYHICFVTNSEIGNATFYVNGEVNKVVEHKQKETFLNGSLVLGQETDSVGGGYQIQQSFSGAITGFNLYSRPLSAAEVLQLSKCSSGSTVEEGDIVAWSTAKWDLLGPVIVQDIQEEDYCIPNNFKFTLFLEQRTHKEALDLCRNLKSSIALPRNKEEDALLYNAAVPFVEQCVPPNLATYFFWLGAIRATGGNWTNDQGIPLDYNTFSSDPPKADAKCSGYQIPKFERGKWRYSLCSDETKFCSACQETKPVLITMRGLCESASHSRIFRMVEQRGEMPIFKSFLKYNIAYDKNGTWSLYDVRTNTTLATYFTYFKELPFGLKEWFTTTDFDICKKPKNSSHMMSFSACYDWEYSCGDGSCISLTQRCDMHEDCPDNTDEINCEKLAKPKDYLESLLPPGLRQEGPLQVKINVSILGVSEIDIRNNMLEMDLTLVMTWFDSRLKFKNLQNVNDLNYIEPPFQQSSPFTPRLDPRLYKSKSVWTPRIELLNADFPEIKKTEVILTILRTSSPEEDDPSMPLRDEVYKGSKNPIRYAQKYNAPFTCNMNLRNFPFDTQHCKLYIRFSSAKKELLQWGDMAAEYLGSVTLPEFRVGNITMERKLDDNYGLAVVSITFYRRYGYYLTNVYLPTLMLMIISYFSLFCKKDESGALRVMMALTTLLVLYALFQQISRDVPRTAYTKAIDIWWSFSLTFIFSKVILQVLVTYRFRQFLGHFCLQFSSKVKEFELQEHSSTVIPKGYSKNTSSPARRVSSQTLQNVESQVRGETERGKLEEEEDNNKHMRIKLIRARIFYGVVFISFCVIYWVVVIISVY